MEKRRHVLKPNKRNLILWRSRGFCEREGCDEKINISSEVHHIIPVFLGGTDELNNLAIICDKCHLEISQDYQRIIVNIDNYENFLIKHPLIDFIRKKRIKIMLEVLKKELQQLPLKYEFKNR